MRYRRMLFLTRPGCGLCDEALPVVSRAASWMGVELVVVDIATEPELEAEFHMRIPVLLSRSHKVLAEGRIGGRQAAFSALRAWL